MRIAFVTDYNHADYAEDDRLLVSYLQTQGHVITPAIWDDPAVQWTSFDVLVIRSTWDYHLKIDAFSIWLDYVDQLEIMVFNPVSVLQWNKNKNYLLRFRSLGIAIQPFEYCDEGSQCSLNDMLKRNAWTKAVIKPSISCGAHHTFIVEPNNSNEHQDIFVDLLRDQSMIVQKFSPEIITNGELSLIYFNKEFSHAVCKKVKQGEFRVQARYGGQHQSFIPEQRLMHEADRILALIPEALLYARIDGFLDEKGQFQLMELELLEPSLFFDSNPLATEKFNQAMQYLMDENQSG